MSLKNVEKKKYYKKHKHEIWKKQKRSKMLTSITCLVIIAAMVISPVAVYISSIMNTSHPVETMADGETPQIQVTDENGNVVGYMDSDGNITYLATDSNATATDSDADPSAGIIPNPNVDTAVSEQIPSGTVDAISSADPVDAEMQSLPAADAEE